MGENVIYFDHAATTAVRPLAARAAVEVMTRGYGNPSSAYGLGKGAKERLGSDRAVIAEALGCKDSELYFTSCGTEGDNWAIRAAVEAGRRTGKHIVTTSIEHAAVLETMRDLQAKGYEVTYLRPDKAGRIDSAELEAALRPDTVLVSLMLVNNELGTVQPVKEAAQAIRRTGCPALLHTDGVQGFLKLDMNVQDLGVDFLAVSGHKVGAPKGIGAIFIKSGVKVKPLLFGGGQESGLRSGTEPTAQIAAFAAACREWTEHREEYTKRIIDVKNHFLDSLLAAVPETVVVSRGDAPHICAVSLPGYPSEMLLRELDGRGICASAGSACHQGRPSHVFAATGRPKRELLGTLRFSFGPENTREEAEAAVAALKEITESRVPAR